MKWKQFTFVQNQEQLCSKTLTVIGQCKKGRQKPLKKIILYIIHTYIQYNGMKHPDGHADTKPLGLFVSSYLHQWLFQSKKTFSDLPSQRVNFILQQMAKVCRELLQLSHCFHPNLDLIY